MVPLRRLSPGLVLPLLLGLILPPGAAATPPGEPGSAPASPGFLGTTQFWAAFGLVAGSLALLDFEDPGSVSGPLKNWGDGPVDVGNVYGDGAVLGGLTAGLLAYGGLSGDRGARDLGRDLGISLGLTWSAVWALKIPINRTRPDGGPYSFPSGHTATAFAAAPVLAHHLGTKVGIAAYSLATLTALGRMEDDRHHATDVLAGAALGTLAGQLTLHWTGGSMAVVPTGTGFEFDLTF